MPASEIPLADQTVKKRLYTLAEVESVSTFGRQALYKWHKAGLLEFTRVANRTFLSDTELERLVTGQIALPVGHRAAHWHGAKPQPQPRRRGRPPKRRPEDAAASPAE